MSVILRPEFPAKPHKINPHEGATPEDVAMAINSADVIFSMNTSALIGLLENLKENLPIGEVDFDDIYEIMRDCRSDVLGRLEKAQDKLCGN